MMYPRCLMKMRSPSATGVAMAAGAAAFLVWGAGFIDRTSFVGIDGKRYFCLFDDAMISMRYAWTLAHGHGLVWNEGESIQGYTNLLMTMLMALPAKMLDKATAPLLVQMAGLVIVLATAYMSTRVAGVLARDLPEERRTLIRVLSFFATLAYYPLAYWSLMGMETGLLALLCVSGTFFVLAYGRELNPGTALLAAGCFGLAYLTRNDSVIFAALAFTQAGWSAATSTTPGRRLKELLPALGLYVLFIAGQAYFQWSYYGEVLPNTYTLKLTGMPLDRRVENGLGFILPFLRGTWPVLATACVALAFGARNGKWLLLSIPGAALAYQVYVGGDPWAYWRIVSPTMPLVFVLFSYAVAVAVDAVPISASPRRPCLRSPIGRVRFGREAVMVSLVAIGVSLANTGFLPEMMFERLPYQVEENRANVNVAIALRELTAGSASIGVFWAGAIPYFADRRAVDFLGKTDKYIARLPPDLSGKVAWNGMTSVPGHNKYDLDHSIKALRPEYVQDLVWGTQDLTAWAAGRYARVEYKGLTLFLRVDSPLVFWDRVFMR
jgi:arabinofuranosyltransferase